LRYPVVLAPAAAVPYPLMSVRRLDDDAVLMPSEPLVT
jgi:hypothetical protein